MYARSVLLVFAGMLTACAPLATKPMQTKYNAVEHAGYKQAGTSTLTGQGFMRQQGGGTVTCAGSEVFLVPGTPYFSELIDMGKRKEVPDESSGLKEAMRDVAKRETCDAQGNFRFDRLAAGKWIVMTQVTWTVQYSRNGGVLAKAVTVGAGESQRVLLTDADFIAR